MAKATLRKEDGHRVGHIALFHQVGAQAYSQFKVQFVSGVACQFALVALGLLDFELVVELAAELGLEGPKDPSVLHGLVESALEFTFLV